MLQVCLLTPAALRQFLLISLIIVITRHYNFFSQYVKELGSKFSELSEFSESLADVLDSNQMIPLYWNHTLSFNV